MIPVSLPNMDRRRNPRITAMLPVRVWGVDAHSLPFMQLATVRNISSSGAVVQGMRRRIQPGEVLEVQSGDEKAEFRVVWVGRTGTSREGEIGLEALAAEPCLWDQDLCRYSELVGTG
jgi:PilZ domain-containing protein